METLVLPNNNTNLTGDPEDVLWIKTKANFEELAGVVGATSEVVPVVRTNNPISATNTSNENIDALDAAIGTDAQVTPLTRTKGPVVVDTSVHQKIDALDAAIGADTDITPLARTAGPVVVDSTILAKIDALDTAIGFDNQMSGTPKVAYKTSNVFQNLDRLDTYMGARIIKKKIGGVGVAGCDFNFASAANMTEQVINLGAIIPARARILDVHTHTSAAFVFSGGGTTLAAETGTSSSGNELIASATIYALNAITQPAVGAGFTLAAIVGTAGNVYLSATPGANWNTNTAGQVDVYITVIDPTNL